MDTAQTERSAALVSRSLASLRVPVVVDAMPAAARALAQPLAAKPRGAARIVHKLRRAWFRWLHHRLAVPATGRLRLRHPGGDRPFVVDFRNTALIDYVRRSRRDGYESEVSTLLDLLAPDLGVVYDIGANWGYFVALLMTTARFQGRMHAFEIAPSTARALVEMVATCGLQERVTCHGVGLSDRTGTVRLVEGLHSALTQVSASSAGPEVPVAALDTLELPDPDFIKLDVEGHEAAVLRGGRRRIARARPIIVLESWYLADDNARMIEPLALLVEQGYSLYQLAWCDAAMTPPVFQREAGAASAVRLALVPLSLALRPLLPAALNVLAVHPERASLLRDFVPVAAA